MSILQVTNLKKYYGKEPYITKALDGIDFGVEEGEFVAIVGTSGSGKSTLLTCTIKISNIIINYLLPQKTFGIILQKIVPKVFFFRRKIFAQFPGIFL